MRITHVIVATLALAGASSVIAQGCCASESTSHAGCAMKGAAAASETPGHSCSRVTDAGAVTSAPRKVFMEPLQSVFDNYIKVQAALAADSLEGVGAIAGRMAKAIQVDSMKPLPPKVAEQAAALSAAKDLEEARKAFKPLSESLVQFLKDQKLAAGVYHEAYCPMAKASWLQADKTLANPYMGKAMVSCGEFKS